MEDQSADPGDLTTGAAETADSAGQTVEAPSARRRWFRFGRKAKTEPSEPDSVDAVETEPAPRVPVGKSRRTAQAQADEPAPAEAAEDSAHHRSDVDAVDPEAPGVAAATESTEAVEGTDAIESTEAAEGTDATESTEAASETTEEPVAEPVLVPHRPAGKRLTAAAVAAGVIFVAAAGFAGATVQPYLADRAAVDTKLDVARTAASAISTLWTYTPDSMESLPDRAEAFLGGDFAHEYRKYIDAIVAPNKQAQVSNTTQVMGAAVETLDNDEATAIVYTNSVATSPVTKNIPSLRYLSYRLTMQRHDAKWLITRMSTVTQFDLTPQL